jgi:hypothetical protein
MLVLGPTAKFEEARVQIESAGVLVEETRVRVEDAGDCEKSRPSIVSTCQHFHGSLLRYTTFTFTTLNRSR